MGELSSSKRPGVITFTSMKMLYRPSAVAGTATVTRDGRKPLAGCST